MDNHTQNAQKEVGLYPPGLVSEMLKIPPSSLSRYARLFRSFLSESAQIKGKKRRYTERDTLVLRKIREFSAKKTPFETIVKQLNVLDAAEFPTKGSTLAMIPAFQEEMERINFTSRQHQEKIKSLESESAAKEAIINDLMTRIEALEDQARQPWWRRLFGRSPED